MKGYALLGVALLLAACTSTGNDLDPSSTFVVPTTTTLVEVPTTDTGALPMEVTSEAFTPGSPIPVEYTCDGANVSPLSESAVCPWARVLSS